jgi:hypothetical protein
LRQAKKFLVVMLYNPRAFAPLDKKSVKLENRDQA